MSNSNTPNVDVVITRVIGELEGMLEAADRLMVVTELLNDPECDKQRVIQELRGEYPSVMASLREIVERTNVSYRYLQNLQKVKKPPIKKRERERVTVGN